MPTVTSIKRRRGALAVQLAGDGGEHLLARDPVAAFGLVEGATLDEAEWDDLRLRGRHLLVLERALASLSHRSHTEHELRQRLGRQFTTDEIDGAVDRLRQLGYLDDARWAAEFVEARKTRYGTRRLRQDLLRRGVAREHSDAVTGDLDESSAALAAAQRRLRSLSRLDRPQQQRRLYGYLQRRGFSHDATQRAIAETLEVERELD